MTPEFKPFPKLSRWSRDVVITEKIDGTNACVIINEDGSFGGCQSRNKLITPEDDNMGFATWAYSNKEILEKYLGGHGHHFGEWWGQGIQRRYDMKQKKFSLFNTARHTEKFKNLYDNNILDPQIGLDVVPVLWQGSMDEAHIRLQLAMQDLENNGSVASQRFMNPEGVVVFHSAGGYLFKKTFESDEKGKGQ